MVLGIVSKRFKMLLWILIGLNIITKVHGWGDGNFADTLTCKSMLPTHETGGSVIGPQQTVPPFEIIVKPRTQGHPITVVLKSKDSTEFTGFMLQARKTGSDVPVGKFIMLESAQAQVQLLSCSDSPDTAVSQRNDQRKTSIEVNWTLPETDRDVVFRATFVENFRTFWERVDKAVPPQPTTPSPTTPSTTTSTEPSTTTSAEPTTTTTAEPSTRTSAEPTTTTSAEPSTRTSAEPSTTTSAEPSTTTSAEPSTTTSAEPSTTTSAEPSTSTSTKPITAVSSTTEACMPTKLRHDPKQVAGKVAMNAVSFMAGVKMVLPNVFTTTLTSISFSRCLNKVSKITCSLLCAIADFSTLVLFSVAEPIQVTLIALVCVVVVINFIELVILCLPIGPSHELKEICDLTIKVCSVVHQIFTIAVIFVGVMENENCKKGGKDSWLVKVMVAYTVWILLFVIWVFVINTQREAILGRSRRGSPKWKGQQRKEKLSAAKVTITAVSAIFFVGNLCFAVAVTVGIFRYQGKCA